MLFAVLIRKEESRHEEHTHRRLFVTPRAVNVGGIDTALCDLAVRPR